MRFVYSISCQVLAIAKSSAKSDTLNCLTIRITRPYPIVGEVRTTYATSTAMAVKYKSREIFITSSSVIDIPTEPGQSRRMLSALTRPTWPSEAARSV
jgi:hypothetical protein